MNRQGIEGIPDHLKVVACRTLEKGDHYLVWGENRTWNYPDSTDHYPVVEPDNVYNVYDLADVKIPGGYEFAGFREPVVGEKYESRLGGLITSENNLADFIKDRRRIIVKPVAKKTRRVLVVEQEIPEDFNIDSVLAVAYDICEPDLEVVYRIEEREIN